MPRQALTTLGSVSILLTIFDPREIRLGRCAEPVEICALKTRVCRAAPLSTLLDLELGGYDFYLATSQRCVTDEKASKHWHEQFRASLTHQT